MSVSPHSLYHPCFDIFLPRRLFFSRLSLCLFQFFSFFYLFTLILFLYLNCLGSESIRPVKIVPVQRLAIGKVDLIWMFLLYLTHYHLRDYHSTISMKWSNCDEIISWKFVQLITGYLDRIIVLLTLLNILSSLPPNLKPSTTILLPILSSFFLHFLHSSE